MILERPAAGRPITLVQYWAGCPATPNSKWQRFLEVVRACGRQGWRTCMVWTSLPGDATLWRPFEQAGCRIILQPRPAGSIDPACIARTRRLLADLRCDIFHCHNVHTSPLIGAAMAGVPVRIWSVLAMSRAYEEGSVPRGVHRWAPSLRLSCGLATRVWAISRPVRRELLELGVAAGRVQVMPVPVDVDRCMHALPSPVRDELALGSSDLLVTTVGRAVPLKGWDLLVEAFARIGPGTGRAHLLLVGSISRPEEIAFAGRLRGLAARHGIAGRVHFLGQRTDIPGILKASDIFAFPSRSDGQGLALTEAMAAGLPCVAARAGGVPDLLQHGRNGLLFAREDVPGLAHHLECLLRDADLRQRLAAAAGRDSARFSMHAYVQRSLQGYTDLLRRPDVQRAGI